VVSERCELCGRRKTPLVRTDCCGRMVCDDWAQRDLGMRRSRCRRSHERYTLCGFHHAERHRGHWKSCRACGKSFEVEMYVWYGTNRHNFEKLENPPTYEPTRCVGCRRVIVLSKDGHEIGPEGYRCEACFED
jgi:hypothetical protein